MLSHRRVQESSKFSKLRQILGSAARFQMEVVKHRQISVLHSMVFHSVGCDQLEHQIREWGEEESGSMTILTQEQHTFLLQMGRC